MTKARPYAYLLCTRESAYKHYFIGIINSFDDYFHYKVVTAYGRCGHSPRSGKQNSFRNLQAATMYADSIIREKIQKGYINTLFNKVRYPTPKWWAEELVKTSNMKAKQKGILRRNNAEWGF